MPDLAVVDNLPILRVTILLAIDEKTRIMLRTDKPTFQTKHGLSDADMKILEKGDFSALETAIINVQTTISPFAPISPLSPTS